MNENYRPRLSVEISEEKLADLQAMDLPRGWQKILFNRLIDDVLELHARYGTKAIACLVGDYAKPSDVLPTLQEGISYGEKFNKGDDNG